MFKQNEEIKVKPYGYNVLVKVVIDDFSVFQLSTGAKGDLKGTNTRFYIQAISSNIKDIKVKSRILLPYDIMSRCGGFLTDIDNIQGFDYVSNFYRELNQKDREIFNKNTPRLQLTEYIIIGMTDIQATIG